MVMRELIVQARVLTQNSGWKVRQPVEDEKKPVIERQRPFIGRYLKCQ